MKRVLIIGAGLAGLAAGCYAQMNGYESHIFEMHELPGGLCTAWDRKGYIFDGCLHYLFGSGQGQPFHSLWAELGAVQGRRMIHHSELMRVVDTDGRTFIAYCDPDRLAQHIAELSPVDARLGQQVAEGVRLFTRFDMSLLRQKPRPLMTAVDGLNLGRQMLPFAGALAQWSLVSTAEVAARFHDPLLQKAFPLIFGWPEIPMMGALSLLAYMQTGNAGFPVGGSLAFARAIEHRYLALGGQIHYKAQVEKILVERDRAVGVRLYDDAGPDAGPEYRGDVVISAADGRSTLFHLLDDRYTSRAARDLYSGRLPIHSQVQVSLGVDRDLSSEPHWTTYLLPEPITLAGEERPALGVKHYSFDPSLAPAGKAVVEVMMRSHYDYWQRIYGRRLYDTEQNEVAQQVIHALDRLYPGLAGQVEATDVATPLSYERYTGNWMGATCGWLLTKDTMRMMISGISPTLPGLDHFYLCGQWIEPGGTAPMAALSGRNVIQLLCHRDRRPFRATQPDAIG